jgi:hypothetical protein
MVSEIIFVFPIIYFVCLNGFKLSVKSTFKMFFNWKKVVYCYMCIAIENRQTIASA